MQGNVVTALLLTTSAGLATGVGSAMALVGRRTSPRFLSAALGFSAGVMIYLSFVEVLPESRAFLETDFGPERGSWLSLAAFFGGMLVIALLDRILPSFENPHEARTVEEMDVLPDKQHLLRMGLFTAMCIALHNFPEGAATFISGMHNTRLGVSIAIAIALHNIPEGIAVAVPIYYATGSRRKAFWLSFLSGVAEPVAGLITFLVVRVTSAGSLLGVLFGAVAGIMVFLSLDELLPTARQYGRGHLAIYGTIVGMVVMAISLVCFR